ncbi:MAG: Gfo/Idh/MocA family oxidoreductase [Planctomycetota bacterium]
MQPTQPLRLGMVGGGPGAFIGAVHRIAAQMDGEFQLVAGAFSSDPVKGRERALEWGVRADRTYSSWQQMIASESALPESQRIQALSIVTPNHLHHEVAIAALDARIHVACDKPLTTSSELAAKVADAVERSGKLFLLTHNYTGHPLVREMRERIAAGAIGEVRKVYVEYLQGWLADDLESTGQKQASWRTDPARSGPGGSLGDIGTHAFNLAEFVTGRRVTKLYGRKRAFVEGRPVDDDAMALLEFDGGADGMLRCSQVCVGRENGLRIEVFGTDGGFEWKQEHPNDLTCFRKDGGAVIERTGNGHLGALAKSSSRIPPGHPEGYLEAFANLYREFAASIRAKSALPEHTPSVDAGVRGVRFVEAVIESNERGSWVGI